MVLPQKKKGKEKKSEVNKEEKKQKQSETAIGTAIKKRERG